LTCSVNDVTVPRMPVDTSAVGKRLESVKTQHTQRDVMLYALGVGCGTDELAFTYERDLKVLPDVRGASRRSPPC
jgi:hypothetical protein